MTNNAIPTRPHNLILDGLRGVAAKIVIAFHLCELHATSHITQLVNYGYLAVGGDVDWVHASTRTVADGYSGMAGNASAEVITREFLWRPPGLMHCLLLSGHLFLLT